MIVTAALAGELNKASPEMDKAKVGDELRTLGLYVPVILTIPITAAANSTAVSVSLPFAFELLDVIVQARATSGSGTVTVRKGTTAITDAIAMATDTAITRAGTIDDAQSTIALTDSINLITNGANDRGLVTLVGKRAA